MPYGITIKHDQGGKRLEVGCPHQSGLLYVVPSEASWVCTEENLHAHALAGFFKELARLQDPQVNALMRRWGLYFRERPVESEEEAKQG
ncbi:MAG: hypothetical protein HY680_11600 [Chloroflexi bacterium]|nr:hypothetical protein [Chloroflexota bacterium]